MAQHDAPAPNLTTLPEEVRAQILSYVAATVTPCHTIVILKQNFPILRDSGDFNGSLRSIFHCIDTSDNPRPEEIGTSSTSDRDMEVEVEIVGDSWQGTYTHQEEHWQILGQ
jgi:hypothetical protein